MAACSESHSRTATKNVGLAFLLNAFFTVIEVIGAIFSHSSALMADAIHDLGDTLTLGVAFLVQRFSEKESDSDYTYGYARYSLMSALFAAGVLLMGSVFILIHTIPKFWEPHEVKADLMIGVAVFGVLINGIAFYKLSKGKSQNEKVLSWHLFEDFAGWILTLVASVVIYFTSWHWVDPLLACFLAVFILWHVVGATKTTIELLNQKVPEDFSKKEFSRELLQHADLLDLHDLHVWSLDGENNVMSLHAVVRDHVKDFEEIKTYIRQTANKQGCFHVTIEVEFETESCTEERHGE